jgi:hypothetical protein
LEGLRGQADLDENGIVTARELEVFTYISKYSSRNAHFRPRTLRRGCNFDIGLTDQRLKSNSPNQGAGQSKDKPPDGNNTRAEIIGPPRQPEPSVDRNGGDYALLFANDRFDNPSWATLKNPLNDVNAVARELKERYGFKEVIVRHNLTTDDIYAEVATYQRRKFQPDDQLFVFFAGHGVTDEFGGGFYVGRDSPYPLVRQTQGQFVQLDRLLQLIDQLPVEHSMVVFDACFAGQIWQPKIQIIQETATLPPSNSPSQMASTFPRRYPATGSYSFATNYTSLSRQQELSTLAYAKRIMKSRARRVLTSGDKPVLDAWRKPDGVLSNHSPFADGFLRALRSDAGSDKVLTAAEIKPFIDKLIPEPQVGKLSGAAGDVVFILATQEK